MDRLTQPKAGYTDSYEASNPVEIPLNRIGGIADNAETAAGYIQSFLARFHGTGEALGKNGPSPVPSGHVGQIERLTDAVHKLDCLARELGSIG